MESLLTGSTGEGAQQQQAQQQQNQQQQQAGDWLAQVPETIRQNENYGRALTSIQQKYGNDPNKVYAGLLEAYQHVGKQQEGTIKVPGDNATDQEKQAFHQAIRTINKAPEKPEQYQCTVKIQGDNGQEAAVTLDPMVDQVVRRMCHGAGVGNAFYNQVVEQIVTMNEAATKEAHKALMGEWGSDFLPRIQQVRREVQGMPKELQEEMGKYANDPAMAKLIYWFIQGRKPDSLPAEKGGIVGMNKEAAQTEAYQIRNKLMSMDRHNPEYDALNRRLDDLEVMINS